MSEQVIEVDVDLSDLNDEVINLTEYHLNDEVVDLTETFELAEKIIKVRAERTKKKGRLEPKSAFYLQKEIVHGSPIWMVNCYNPSKYIEFAGYLVSVHPDNKAMFEYDRQPFNPRHFPIKAQQKSNHRLIGILGNGFFPSEEEAIEYLINFKQSLIKQKMIYIDELKKDLDQALSLRKK